VRNLCRRCGTLLIYERIPLAAHDQHSARSLSEPHRRKPFHRVSRHFVLVTSHRAVQRLTTH
jgi:hypothetical protein